MQTQNHLCGATANVNHQPRQCRGLQTSYAGIDQASFFTARDDFNFVAQHILCTRQKGIAVLGFT